MTMPTPHRVPAPLRALVAADVAPIRPLGPPVVRALAIVPFAVLALLAAQAWFSPRPDITLLGWWYAWGWSIAQTMVGVGLVAAALTEAVPGRAWSRNVLALWLALPVALVTLVTMTTFAVSPVALGRGWWVIGGLCLVGSVVTALPGVLMASLLTARAYPTRPRLAGLLGGLGAGLMADAGWRLFCHFSEPSHVLAAHLGGVLLAGAFGSWVQRSRVVVRGPELASRR